MKKRLFLTAFLTALSLTTIGCNSKSNKLELLYFGKIQEENQVVENKIRMLPNRLRNDEPADQNYEIYFGEGISLEAHVKNTDRLSFLDIVLFSASTGKKYVYTAGAGDYVVESSTVLSNNVWTTKLRFQWIDWEIFGQETDLCHFETYLEIEEINFLTTSGSVTRTNIASSDIKKVNLFAVDFNDNKHTWSDYETIAPTCEDPGTKTRHCTACNTKQNYFFQEPFGHQCDNWVIQTNVPGVLQQGDKIVSEDECKRCHKRPTLTLPNFSAPIDLVIPNSITRIESDAFLACSGLRSVTIPSSVTYIAEHAFTSCDCLMSVYFESEVPPTIGSDVFCGTWDRESFKIYVPCTSGETYRNVTAGYWQEYAVSHIVEHLLDEVSVETPATCVQEGKRISKCRLCHREIEEVLPAQGHLFTDARQVTEITECGTDEYGVRTCLRCGVEDKELWGSNSNHIWQWSFEEGITSITTETEIIKACSQCGKKQIISSYNRSQEIRLITDIIIPNTVTSIGADAFGDYDSLETIIIPETVQSLGSGAFAGCYNLLSVYFRSEVPPQIGSDLFAGTWDRNEFKIYVPEESVDAYKAITAGYWQSSAVKHIVGYNVHNYDDGVVVTAVSCTQDGLIRYTCQDCGKVKDVIVPGGHKYDEGVVITPAGNGSDGEIEYTCTVCGHKKTAAIGHDLAVGTPFTNSKGKAIYPYICNNCGLERGYQMAFKDCEDSSNIEMNGKVKDGTTLTWRFKVARAGTIDFYAYAKLGSNDYDFANGYGLKAGNSVGTVDIVGKKLSDYGATRDKSVYFKVGSVTFRDSDIDDNGEVLISYIYPSKQDYRHIYSENVKIMYVD